MNTPSSFLKSLGRGLAAAVFVLDQASKWLILDLFSASPRVIEVLPFFNLVLAWNRGISFGMFGGLGDWGPWILVGLALVICVVLVLWLAKAENRITAASLGLIIGGAAGNVVDRVRFQAVVDFLDVHAFGYHWPAFNVADSAICIGAVILILDSLFFNVEKPKLDS
jgi:signal peptidase II